MRLLHININNLNSLRGEHRIDFTEPPLADYPLYAIVGPTGAGKTTILDAITLALFGRTDRAPSRSSVDDGSDSVMTHGTGECQAEVEFEAGPKRYRSGYYRHRAHRKAGGNLQPARRELSRYNPQTDAFDILSNKITELNQLVEEVLGMNYDRFVRSVMLTQGEFSRFLRSNGGEKADILEQITGTDIYQHLSAGAFERHKQAREDHRRAVESLARIMPLAHEARDGLERRLAEVTGEATKGNQKLDALRQSLARHKEKNKLTEELAHAERSLVNYQQKWDASDPQRRQLATSDRLEPARSDLARLQQLTTDRRRLFEKLEAVRKEAEATSREATKAAAELQRARREEKNILEEAADRERSLCDAEALEGEIKQLGEEAKSVDNLMVQRHEALREKSAAVGRLELEVNQLKAEVGEHTASGVRARMEALAKHSEELREKIAATQRGLRYRELEEKTRRARTQTEELKRRAAHDRRALEQTEHEEKLMERELDLRKQELATTQLRASLEEHRHLLRVGHPCPLCGAEHHPLANDLPAAKGKIGRLEKEIAGFDQRFARLDVRMGTLRQTYARSQSAYDNQVGKLEELRDRLSDIRPAPTADADDLGRQLATAEGELKDATGTYHHLSALQEKLPALQQKQTLLTTGEERVTELQAEINSYATQLNTLRASVEEKRQALGTLVGEQTTQQLRRYYRDRTEELRRRRSAAEQRQQQLALSLTATNTELTGLQRQLTDVETRLAETTKRIERLLSGTPFTIASAHQNLLPSGEVNQLRTRIEEAGRELRTATALVARTRQKQVEATAAVAELPDESALATKYDELRLRLEELQREVGKLELQRQQDDERRQQTADKRHEIERLESERERWGRLNELIGSADGKKFRSFAQAITLRRLVHLGNRHLSGINPRYRMRYAPPAPGKPENLEIGIVDTYMNDNYRAASTLSGGETFLISLALALGLSDLASGRRIIQSLFIDEGFGTLDAQTLDQVMVTLEQLQNQGKRIGIISHVPALRERIHCQIRVKPVGDGFSRIELTN